MTPALRRLGGDAAATLVEYALLVALIMVVCLASIGALTDSGEDELTDSGDRVGTFDDNAYYAASGAPTTTSPSGTTTTTTAPVSIQPSSLTATPAPTNSANQWIASATVTVTRTSSSTPVAGVLVTGQWTLPAGGSTDTANCTTGPAGTCSVQRTDIPDSKNSAVFTITSVSGSGFTWTPGSGTTTVTVPCSPPLNAGCD